MILETPTWVPPEAQVRVPARTLTCEAEKSTEQWAAVMTVLALTKTPPQK